MFMGLLKNAPCDYPLRSPATDLELMERTLAIMKRRNIYRAVSGPLVEQWHQAASDRIIPGLGFTLGPNAPSASRVAELFQGGQFAVLGEVGIQYQGIEPGDQRLEPYLAVVEEMDVPVMIHVGPGPPGTPYLPGSGAYRARLHSPLVLEEALVRHPKLRVVAMHAGWPMLDDTLAMLWTHPHLHVDVGVISFAIPRAAFHSYLCAMVESGIRPPGFVLVESGIRPPGFVRLGPDRVARGN
jgi:predicted TIM-barrel fold metal-dependent hydrolase